jgi:hypothetical protein
MDGQRSPSWCPAPTRLFLGTAYCFSAALYWLGSSQHCWHSLGRFCRTGQQPRHTAGSVLQASTGGCGRQSSIMQKLARLAMASWTRACALYCALRQASLARKRAAALPCGLAGGGAGELRATPLTCRRHGPQFAPAVQKGPLPAHLSVVCLCPLTS